MIDSAPVDSAVPPSARINDTAGLMETSSSAPGTSAPAGQEAVPSATTSQPTVQTLATAGDAATIRSSVGQHNVAPATTDLTAKEGSNTSDPTRELWASAQQHEHKEIWGVVLSSPAHHIPTHIILTKYLNANDGDVARAKEQLSKTLDWRAKTKPLDQLTKSFSREKFSGLGFVTSYATAEPATADTREVFTWNVYGGPGLDIAKSFGDTDSFISWRATLMELAMHELDLNSATQRITVEHDPYKIYQVHDYKGTSFFRSPPQVRAAAKKTIEVLAMAYPETLKEKFFVNVPAIMGFMYGIMKVFVAAKTIKRFHPMSNGEGLVHEFGDSKVKGLGQMLPKEYGGKGEPLSMVGKQTDFE